MLEPPRPGVLFSGGKDSLPGQRREDRGRPPGSRGKKLWCRRGKDSLPRPAPGEQAPRRIPREWISPAPKEPGVEEERPPGGTRRWDRPPSPKTGERRPAI